MEVVLLSGVGKVVGALYDEEKENAPADKQEGEHRDYQGLSSVVGIVRHSGPLSNKKHVPVFHPSPRSGETEKAGSIF